MEDSQDSRHAAATSCCCSSTKCQASMGQISQASLSRRHLILGMSTAAVGTWALTNQSAGSETAGVATRPVINSVKEVTVLPVLTYELPKRQEMKSWRGWGGLSSAADVDEEVKRIETELHHAVASNGLAIKLLPIAKVSTMDEADRVKQTAYDVMLVYASRAHVLDALVPTDRPSLFFLRHKSGPISLWYEVMHPIFLRKYTDECCRKGVDVQDVVVDDYDELSWRLRSLAGLRKTMGQKIVALGGAHGWGKVASKVAPRLAREKWQLDIVEVSYDDLGPRIDKLREDKNAVADAAREATRYLSQPNLELHTDKRYVENAFLLYRIFKDILSEHSATAFTIAGCMSTVMPISKTTACLPLSLLNDEGYLAFCESDFAVIPSGILMHHITGLPVFLNDPTWPHHGVVTLAHCTAPRKMDGKAYEPTKIYTHFESDFGAAPKVDMRRGQQVTVVVPDFVDEKWLGFKGQIADHPFHAICRSQVDVAIEGDWQRLLRDMRGFHWMLVYGDCLKEVGYAIKHLGIAWDNISA